MPHTQGSGYETSLSSTAALILSYHIVHCRSLVSPLDGMAYTCIKVPQGQPNAVRDKLPPRLHPPDVAFHLYLKGTILEPPFKKLWLQAWMATRAQNKLEGWGLVSHLMKSAELKWIFVSYIAVLNTVAKRPEVIVGRTAGAGLWYCGGLGRTLVNIHAWTTVP